MRFNYTVLKAHIYRLLIALVLFAVVVLTIATFYPDASPPMLALIPIGGVFSMSFLVAGQPLKSVPWRKGGQFGVFLSYVVFAIGVATSVYVTWKLYEYTTIAPVV